MKYRIGKIKYDLYAKDKDAKTSLREFYQRDAGGYYSRSYNMSKLRTLRPYCFAYRVLGGTVTIPSEIEEIPEGAFYHAYFGSNFSTNSLVLKKIGKKAFEGASLYNSLTISEGVEYIDEDAFYGLEDSASITLPSTLKSIGSYAFYKFDREYITFRGTVEQWKTVRLGYNCFYNSSVAYIKCSDGEVYL